MFPCVTVMSSLHISQFIGTSKLVGQCRWCCQLNFCGCASERLGVPYNHHKSDGLRMHMPVITVYMSGQDIKMTCQMEWLSVYAPNVHGVASMCIQAYLNLSDT